MTTTKHDPLARTPRASEDREEQHIHTIDTARHVGLPMAGAVSGAALGALVGAVAGPPGAVTGAVLGGVAGAAAGRALDVDESRLSKREGELDDEAVRSENFRAAPAAPPMQEPEGMPGTRWVPESWPPETGSTNGGQPMQATTIAPTARHRARVVRLINGLIETSVDAEKRFATAAADARDPTHKRTLHRYAAQRARFTMALQGALARMGAASLNEGTAFGALSRGWETLKIALVAHDDGLILRDCAGADALATRTYDAAHNALLDADAPAETIALIDGQRVEISIANAHLAVLGSS